MDISSPRPEASRVPLTPERPFPGPHPYTEGDAPYFNGREEDTRKLGTLVDAQPLTVLFGASGLGKSSLLSAGLFPALRRKEHLPIHVLLKHLLPSSSQGSDGDAQALCRQIVDAVRHAASAANCQLEHDQNHGTLWEFFHSTEIWSPSVQLATPVVVLDQFEEAFTLGSQTTASRAQVEQLLQELADLIENRIPKVLAAKLSANPSDPRVGFTARWPQVKVVLALREEYLPHLEVSRREMPSIMRNRMRLLPFSGSAAKGTIRKAAPRLIEDEVAVAIVRSVAGHQRGANEGSEYGANELDALTIEPAILNLFCFQLNERRLRAKVPTINVKLVQATGSDILADFYRDCLLELPKTTSDFVENKLVSPAGYRLPVPEAEALNQEGISEDVLLTLERRRLTRRETRSQGMYVELVHDVLAPTIVEVRQRRKTESRERTLRWAVLAVASLLGVAVLVATAIYNDQSGDILRKLNPEVKAAEQELADALHDKDLALVELKKVRAQATTARDEATTARAEATAARAEATTAANEAQKATAMKSKAEQEAARAQLQLLLLEEQGAEKDAALKASKEQLDYLRKEQKMVQEMIDRMLLEHSIPPRGKREQETPK